jgi:mitogen-activated protein kinase 1/3
MTKRLLKSKD